MPLDERYSAICRNGLEGSPDPVTSWAEGDPFMSFRCPESGEPPGRASPTEAG